MQLSSSRAVHAKAVNHRQSGLKIFRKKTDFRAQMVATRKRKRYCDGSNSKNAKLLLSLKMIRMFRPKTAIFAPKYAFFGTFRPCWLIWCPIAWCLRCAGRSIDRASTYFIFIRKSCRSAIQELFSREREGGRQCMAELGLVTKSWAQTNHKDLK